MSRVCLNHGLIAAAMFVVLSEPLVHAGTGDLRTGRRIYRQLCSECHGRDGEGVAKKYDDALYGDWSLERLTRYIDRSMPDGAPEKCTGEDAAAVARYVYDTFYSPEARWRRNPPRIELARLTNRQFANATADLIRHFTGDGERIREERGLRAVYYSSKDFNRSARFAERIDPGIDFDFGTNGPDNERSFTNGFSMQWRGSLIADETGEYEFILRTPNGARLWVNDDDEPLIDAWVASGEASEHKATIRLLGGRAYPIQVHYFKFKDRNASVSLQWKPPHGVQQVIPMRNLAPERVTPTFVVTTPFPPDDSSVGYERGISVSKEWDSAATMAAIELAQYTVKHLDRLSRSKPGDTNRTEKVERFAGEFVRTAFRGRLTDDQKRTIVSSQFKRATRMEDAVKRVVLLTMKSPRFLYPAVEKTGPNQHLAAERLSFALWDSIPDAGLIAAADAGRLGTREEISAQATRMLRDPRARAKLREFFHHWLQMNHVDSLSKDATLYPGFTPEIIADLRTSLEIFLDNVMWSERSDFRELLWADYLYLNNRLAEFYGVATNATGDFVKVELKPAERSGVLTHPYLLAALSYQKSSSPIHRGVFLTRNIIGRALKPPPVAVAFNEAEFSPGLSMREKVAELTRSESCQTCHSVINPLGFSLEHYDAVGRFRTVEQDRPIDVVSEYIADDGRVVRLNGARDVANFAVESPQAQNGFIEQLFHQIVKQPVAAYGPRTMDRLRELFAESDFQMQKLVTEIAIIAALEERPPL